MRSRKPLTKTLAARLLDVAKGDSIQSTYGRELVRKGLVTRLDPSETGWRRSAWQRSVGPMHFHYRLTPLGTAALNEQQ